MTTDPNTLSQAQELHLLYCMAQGKTTDIAQDWENLGEERQAFFIQIVQLLPTIQTGMVQGIEEALTDLKAHKSMLQRNISKLQEELTEIGKIEYKLTKLLPYKNRIDRLLSE